MSPNGFDEHHTANGVSVLPHPAWTQAEIALETCHIELAKADSNSEACQGDSAEDAVGRIPGASSGGSLSSPFQYEQGWDFRWIEDQHLWRQAGLGCGAKERGPHVHLSEGEENKHAIFSWSQSTAT